MNVLSCAQSRLSMEISASVNVCACMRMCVCVERVCGVCVCVCGQCMHEGVVSLIN